MDRESKQLKSRHLELNHNWDSYIVTLNKCLNGMIVTDPKQICIDNDAAFSQWHDTTVYIRKTEKVVYLMGNGASASMASHFAADLAKNAFLHTQVFTDIALITAIANDFSYSDVFLEPLRKRVKTGDMIVAISSSGNSPNVVKACKYGAEKGANVITLSAMGPDNQLRRIGKLNFWIPATTYGMAETSHAAILHHWMDSISMNP